jgi:hypothetical protein
MNSLKTLKILSVCVLTLLFMSKESKAAGRYWVGTSSNKNWNTAANWSATSGGSGGASIPSLNDTAIFDGGDTVSCIINTILSVYKFSIKSSYPGSIQQNGNIVIVGVGGFKQDAGTFLGTTASVTLGAFTLNGGTFRSTADRLTIQGNYTINSPGNFLHNNGEVFFTGVFSIKAVITLYNCRFYPLSGVGGTYTIDPTTTLTVDHLFTNSGGIINGTGIINVHGDILQDGFGGISSGGTGTIYINGTADQTFTGVSVANSISGAICNVNINKPANTTLFLVGVIAVGGNWTNNSSVIDAGTSSLVFYSTKTITESNVLNNVSLYSPGISATTTIATTTLKVAGDLSIGGGSQIITGGDIEARGNIVGMTYFGQGMVGGTSFIIINGAGDQLFTGTTAAGAGILRNIKINKTQGTLKLSGNISIGGAWTWLSGTVDITTYSSTISFMATTTITGPQSFKNVLFYGASGSLANFNIDPATTLNVTGDITIQAFGSGRVNINGGTIESKGNITLVPGNNLLNGIGGGTALLKMNGSADQTITGTSIFQSQALLPNVEINKTSGNLNLSGIITAGSNWTCTAGAGNMIPGTSTLAFVGGGTITGSQPLYDLSFAPLISGANIFTIASGTTLSVGRNLYISGVGGTVINTGTINVAKDITVSSVSTLSGGTGLITINGSSNQTLTGSGTAGSGRLCNVNIAKTGGVLTLASTISVNGSWSYNASSGGTLDAGTSTVAFYDGPRTISGTQTLKNVSFYATIANGVNTVSATDVFSVDGDLKFFGTYPISINTGTISAKGNITMSSTNTTDVTQTGVVKICGTGSQTLTGSGTYNVGKFGNITVDKPSGTLTLASTITIRGGTWLYVQGDVNPGTSEFCSSGSVINCGTPPANMSLYSLFVYGTTASSLANNLTVKNICSIDVSRVLNSNSYDISVGGRWTNLGTVNMGTGSIIFNGTGDQVITSTETMNNVVINKVSGKLRPQAALVISGSLNLTKGIIVNTNVGLMRFSDNATITGGSNQSYITGALRKIGNDAFTFPLGDTTLPDTSVYHPFSITPPVSILDSYTAQYYAHNQLTDHSTFTSVASTLKPISNCEYWSLTHTAGSSVVTPTLGWNRNVCNMGTLSNMRVASWSGSQWTDLGQNSTTGIASVGTIKAASAGPNVTNQYYALAETNVNIQLYSAYCNASIPITNPLLGSDNNTSQAFYRFEFSTSSTFTGYVDTDTSFYKEFPNGQTKLFKQVSDLRTGNTYYARIRTRSNSSQAWSNPGTICSVTFINNLTISTAYCNATISLSNYISANDNNKDFGLYRFEFSPNAAFTGYDANNAAMYKELNKNQYALYSTVSGLQIGSTYYVRVRIRETSSESWSAAGPVCSVTVANELKLHPSQCDQSVPITRSIEAFDNTATFNFYRYEFSTAADFSGYNASDASMYKEVSTGQLPSFKTVSGLQLDHTYYVRIRLRANASDAWSTPGPVCSVTLINDLKIHPAYCDKSFAITNGIEAFDNTALHDFYRYEFSTTADFSTFNSTDASMYKEVSTNQLPAFKTVSGLHIDHAYYVRIRLKDNGSSTWSAPGPVCAVTFINDLTISIAYCNATISPNNSIAANDNNEGYGLYRFEFSPNAAFTGYNVSDASMYKEEANRVTFEFSTVSGLQNNHTYYVRVRVRENTSESWSSAGPICSITITLAPLANQRYWIGKGTDKNWNNTSNWSTTSGGSPGAGVPTSTDYVFFDGNGTGALILETNIDVKMFLVGSLYTGSIQQNNYTLTIGTAGMILNGGTFTGGSAAITNNGSLTLGGMNFTSTSAAFTIYGSYSKTGGSFTHNNGSVVLKTGTTISGSTNFYSLELSPTADAVYTLVSSDVLNVMGEFKLSGTPLININSGTIHAQGDVTLANTNVEILGTYTLIIDGTTNQTINGAAAKWQSALNNMVITKTTGIVILKDFISVRGNWTNTNNTATDVSNTSTVVFNGGSKTISGNTTFKNLIFYADGATDGIYTIPPSSRLTTDGELKFEGNRALYLNGNINAKGDIVTFNGSGSIVDGGTGSITICGTGDQLFSGYDTPKGSRTCNIIIDKVSGTLTLDRFITSGHDWTYIKGLMNPGTSTMYFTNSGGNKLISGKNKFNDVVFYGDLYQKDTITVGDTMLVSGELKYSLKGMTINGGTIEAKGNIIINSDDDVIPGTYTLLINGGNNQLLAGTLSMQARAALNNVVIHKTGGLLSLKDNISVKGNWIYEQGNLDAKTNLSTLILRDGNRIFSGTHTLYNVTLKGYDFNAPTINEIPVNDIITVEGEFKLDGGYPAYLNTGTINATGSIRSTNSTVAQSGGTATINICGATDQSMSGQYNGGGRFCNIKVNKPSGVLNLSEIITVGASNWTYVQGTVNPGTSKLVFWGDGSISTVNGTSSMELYHFEVQNGSVMMLSPIIARKDFKTYSSTTLTTNSHDITVGGYFQNGGVFNLGTTTITFNGTGRQDEYTSTSTTYYKVVINKPSGKVFIDDSFVINNNLTLIKGALVPKSSNSGHYIKLLDNATITGGSNASYIACGVMKVGDDAFMFPVGDTTLTDSSTYHPFSIPAPATSATYTVRYYAKNPLTDHPTFTSIQSPLQSISNCEYWYVEGGPAITPTLSWSTNNSNANALADIRVASWDGTQWSNLGNNATSGNLTRGMVQAATISTATYDKYFVVGNINNVQLDPVASFGNPGGTCVNKTITFINTSLHANSYQWKINNANVSTSTNLIYAFNTIGTYTVTLVIDNGTITDTKNVNFIVGSGITADAGTDKTIVNGESIILGGTPAAVTGTAPFTYIWSPATNLSSSIVSNPNAAPTINMVYNLTIQDAQGCSGTDEVQVTVEEGYKSYGELKKALDAGYYQVNASDHMLYFNYKEEYKSGNLNFKIYDNSHEVKNCPTVLTKQYGDNRFGIDLMSCLGASLAKYYLLEVINDKSEKLLLKFKY